VRAYDDAHRAYFEQRSGRWWNRQYEHAGVS
jgi:hypothetical protein